MTYQDLWLNGRCIKRGERECASRYELVRQVCALFEGPFTVCDIGANMCYFGIRLAEDFPLCEVMAFEFDHFELRERHLRANDVCGRVSLVKKRLTVEDVLQLPRFDLVLALSVMHHLPGEHEWWLSALRSVGDSVIVEYALGDSPRSALRKGYGVPHWASLLGYGTSHLDPSVRRPIVLLPGLRHRESLPSTA